MSIIAIHEPQLIHVVVLRVAAAVSNDFDEGILSTAFALTARVGQMGTTQIKLLYGQEVVPTNIR